MSKMVQTYWKSVEKITKHNYGVQCEKRRQHVRAKKLENFVSKHLKLSVKVAEELNWIPKETFETGINKTIKWYLKNTTWCNHVKDGSYQGERLGGVKL